MISLLGDMQTLGDGAFADIGDRPSAGQSAGFNPLWDGPAGLGLTGVGEGGGGRGAGIGIGNIGTIGRVGGIGVGVGGCGNGHCASGQVAGAHQTKAPSLRCGPPPGHPELGCTTQVHGRLMPEVVQRVVRANYGRFRSCYADALSANPALEGRVSVKFLIDSDGTVTFAEDAGSDLANAKVVDCIVHSFRRLEFPAPTGGVVSVVYPLVLSST